MSDCKKNGAKSLSGCMTKMAGNWSDWEEEKPGIRSNNKAIIGGKLNQKATEKYSGTSI